MVNILPPGMKSIPTYDNNLLKCQMINNKDNERTVRHLYDYLGSPLIILYRLLFHFSRYVIVSN
jgi:hypothetical protein